MDKVRAVAYHISENIVAEKIELFHINVNFKEMHIVFHSKTH